MAERRGSTSGSSYWVVILAAASVVVSVGGGILSNSQGSIKEVKEDLTKQIAEVKGELVKMQTDARWTYASKDLITGKVDAIREEEKTYRTGIDRSLVRIETKANGLDTEIHGVYSPKDQFSQLNARLIELERAARDKAGK